jgi:hypothetical protein
VTPETARLFFAAGVSLLAGGAIGAYATRAIYGDSPEDIEVVKPQTRICPPCECPTCPPPPDCGDINGVPTSTAPRAILIPEDEEVDRDKKQGLPASAVQMASGKVRLELVPCLATAPPEAHGTVLLDLTVTAADGQGFISEALLTERSGDAVSSGELERCLLEAAQRAKFEWSGEDGEAHVRLPVALKR